MSTLHPDTFGAKLAQLRTERGLTQQALADAAGVCLGVVAAYEQGRRLPLWSTLQRICRVLQCAYTDLEDTTTPTTEEPVR